MGQGSPIIKITKIPERLSPFRDLYHTFIRMIFFVTQLLLLYVGPPLFPAAHHQNIFKYLTKLLLMFFNIQVLSLQTGFIDKILMEGND